MADVETNNGVDKPKKPKTIRVIVAANHGQYRRGQELRLPDNKATKDHIAKGLFRRASN